MARIAVLIIVFLMTIGPAAAAPFLEWDADSNCESYNIYADGVLLAGGYETSRTPPNYDLQSMPVGGIEYTAQCCNYRGCSEVSEPFLSLDDPGQPMNLRLSL